MALLACQGKPKLPLLETINLKQSKIMLALHVRQVVSETWKRLMPKFILKKTKEMRRERASMPMSMRKV